MAEEVSRPEFDITVIGGGPGGYVAAIRAAKEGLRVCLVEKGNLGGVCLNEGCIPTKTLIKTASLFGEMLHAGDFAITGIDPKAIGVSMPRLQERRKMVVDRLVRGVGSLLRGNKVTLVQAEARFLDAHTVQAGDRRISSENFIIATGSSVLIPGFISQEGTNTILTSREALLLDKVPERVAIIGGGVIGVEFAYLLRKLGAQVTVLELLENIMPMVDAEISGLAKKSLERDGVVFHMGARVLGIRDNVIRYDDGSGEKTVPADAVLMAVGRVPYSDNLGAKEIGVMYDRAAIVTDAQLRTSVPNIYAIGDVNARVMLAHTASHEGMVAVEAILGHKSEMRYDRIPSCVYLDPEIASIGLTEKDAEQAGRNIQVGRFPMAANGKTLVEGDTDGMIKVIVDRDLGEVLGVHIHAKHATDIIAEIAVAMNLEATTEEIIGSIHPHPTISEAVPEAFMAANGKAIHCL